QAYDNQDVPFDHVVNAVQPARDPNVNPLFQAMFSFHDPPMPDLTLPHLSLSMDEALSNGFAKFDLDVLVIPRAEQYVGQQVASDTDELTLIWEYNTALFDEAAMQLMMEHYLALLEAVVVHPDQPLAEVDFITRAERELMLTHWNHLQKTEPRSECLHTLFERMAEKVPDAIAVVFKEESLTYGALNAQANQFARHLQQMGAGPEVLIGLAMERSLALCIGLLGILKAGSAYVPLDPRYPLDRLQFICDDAHLHLLVTQESQHASPAWKNVQIVTLAHNWSELASYDAKNRESGVSADNAAYCIYTSGSTGLPKGVVVSHRNLVNHSRAIEQRFDLSANDRALQFTSISFDLAAEEIYPFWQQGATVILRTEAILNSFEQMLSLVEEQAITYLSLPTAYWHAWVASLSQMSPALPDTLRMLTVGGEEPHTNALETWLAYTGGRVRWCNAYGPTETTITTTSYDVEGPDKAECLSYASMPIGHPLFQTQAYVLDQHFRPTPIGIPGELFIGGAGVSRGYLHQPELTAERFVPDPFHQEPGSRLYRTGDKALFLPGGVLVFLGRIDRQVKIRGYRIEPGEIEATIRAHPAVQDVLVDTHTDAGGDVCLVAYIVSPASDTQAVETALLKHIRERLPVYMVPQIWIVLPAFPLLPNGKVDRSALPAPTTTMEQQERAFVAPRTALEEVLVSIWKQLLKIESISVDDNFFELGGHSLLMTRMNSRILKLFQVELPLKRFFDAPTVADQANMLLQDETVPGRLEAIAQVRKKVAAMSVDEIHTQLQSKR
ncbi:MAG TPA: amino acid adenylation domain-containing protein, partial [Ktedonobacteraceae bacterium]|nr:amino acid adenylation domain-containing protein [Ktedonobacteraceae bacterium]